MPSMTKLAGSGTAVGDSVAMTMLSIAQNSSDFPRELLPENTRLAVLPVAVNVRIGLPTP